MLLPVTKLNNYKFLNCFVQKTLIRETKHLSTDADSSTDTTVRWTKNSPKPFFFLTEKIIQIGKNHLKRKKSSKRKKSLKTQKLKKV